MFGRSEHCPGIIYDENQHKRNVEKGYPTNFIWFNVNSIEELTKSQKEYILLGEEEGLDQRYKCRNRTPWFKVPSIYSSEIGMLKRAHEFPRLILNKIHAFTTDTAYRIKMKKYEGNLFVFSFINSLTALSAELEGRHYGGGVLELVPSEIEKLLVPIPNNIDINLEKLNKHFYSKNNHNKILLEQDLIILSRIGLSGIEIEIIQNAWQRLKQRRQRKNGKSIIQFQL